MPPGEWSEYEKLVIAELKRLNQSYEGLRENIEKLNLELTKLKIKAGIWGAIAGAIPGLSIAVLWLLTRLK